MSNRPRKWEIIYIAFLAAIGIVAVIIKDYSAIALLLISTSTAFLMNPKESKAQTVAQIALLSLAIVGACLYFYLRIKTAPQ